MDLTDFEMQDPAADIPVAVDSTAVDLTDLEMRDTGRMALILLQR